MMKVEEAGGAVDRLHDKAREWKVDLARVLETQNSILAFGTRNGLPVVIKIVRAPGDEWRSGAVLKAFAGEGAVQVYEESDGALLIERATPGTSLIELSLDGRDDDATEILCSVIGRLAHSERTAPARIPAIQNWGASLDRYLQSGDAQVPPDLVLQARAVFTDLASTQQNPVLLHGDLQHYNVLRDERRGWLAIDPKGVIGEREYEVGAALRNPIEQFEPFANPAVIERRTRLFETRLGLNAERILWWSFAQGVLSAVWLVEDRIPVMPDHSGLLLARAIEVMTDDRT